MPKFKAGDIAWFPDFYDTPDGEPDKRELYAIVNDTNDNYTIIGAHKVHNVIGRRGGPISSSGSTLFTGELSDKERVRYTMVMMGAATDTEQFVNGGSQDD